MNESPQQNHQTWVLIAYGGILTISGLISYVHAYSPQVWWTEMSVVFFLFALFGLTYRRFQFSTLSYTFLFLWCVLQIIGACYTFERVPFDFIARLFGFERNHYDRIAHFAVGLNAVLIAEYAWRRGWTASKGMAALFSIIAIMAVANFWELVEWLYAEIDGGDAGAAFLGSQGDIWDAQKDMLMDTLGALIGAALFYVASSRAAVAFDKRKTSDES